jgi:hypothetical protein
MKKVGSSGMAGHTLSSPGLSAVALAPEEDMSAQRKNISLNPEVLERAKAVMAARAISRFSHLLATLIREEYERRLIVSGAEQKDLEKLKPKLGALKHLQKHPQPHPKKSSR